ncbi:MAG: hypothetical protein L6Q54_11500 [Leptospiraceae bacterium]|nr:hypothetical protein [Leptospiraceae bacterium]
MTLEEKEIEIVQKFGFKSTKHSDSYLLDDLLLWIDDKINLYLNNQILFRLELTIENFERLEKYLQDFINGGLNEKSKSKNT